MEKSCDSRHFAGTVQKMLLAKTCNLLIKISFFYKKNAAAIAKRFAFRYHQTLFLLEMVKPD
ncbi:MAG TPA: hypothetical protein DEB25_04905 [Desulfobulbaceae bacterium]|nr:hypothetical protein [Desulfobulbaceae bacterium]